MLELDIHSPIVCRVLRIRERIKLEQRYDDSSDLAHMCAGRASYDVHAWEKLSIRSQEPFLSTHPAFDRDAALPDPGRAEQ